MSNPVVIGNAELWLGDCQELLGQIGKVDACITDPPFGIKRSGQVETFTKNPKHKRKFHADCGWDDQRPSKDIFDAIREMSDAQIIWGGNYFADLLPARMRWLYWDKGQDGLSMSDGELAWTSMNNALRARRLNRSAISSDGAEHPTQKPVALMKWCIAFLPDAQTILDPFMGVASTGIAAVQMGRKFIGIEREERYFDIACRRIEQAQRQGDLFIEGAA